jgi:hypothetical protein
LRIAESEGALTLELMVSRRSRSIFAVLLAFALLPIVSMAAGRSQGARADMAWMQSQPKAQSPVEGIRAGLAELAKHHVDAMPFAPAEVFRLALNTSLATSAASVHSAGSVTAPRALHPARAPPTLS